MTNNQSKDKQCFICESVLPSPPQQKDGRLAFNCSRCGVYELPNELHEDELPPSKNRHPRAVLSHATSRMASQGRTPLLTQELVEAILTNEKLPSHSQQLENLIVWMAKEQPQYGKPVPVSEKNLCAISAVGAEDFRSLTFIIEHAIHKNLATSHVEQLSNGNKEFPGLTLTFSGWDFFDEIQKGHTSSRLAFMAMDFGNAEMDALYANHFKVAVTACDFNLQRLDEEQPAGLIDDHLRVKIRQSRFVIADLTHHNKGAYWEAGFAEGLGKPVIYTCEKTVFDERRNGGGTHFDTNHHLTVIWERGKEHEAVQKLKATIRATLPSEAKLND